MADPRYEVRTSAGELVAADDVFDDQLKFEAAKVSGYVIDAQTGAIQYNATPGSGLDSTIL
jgi:hypothetical protein